MSDKKKAQKKIDAYAHDLGYQFSADQIIWALEEVMVAWKMERDGRDG